MTTEDLMKPRYKVIADYPRCPYRIGDIIECIGGGNWDCYSRPTVNGLTEPDKYSANFEPLPWWKGRKAEDMPGYLQCPSRKTFCKVDKWGDGSFVTGGKTKMQMYNYIPATKEDYEVYLQATNQLKDGQ